MQERRTNKGSMSWLRLLEGGKCEGWAGSFGKMDGTEYYKIDGESYDTWLFGFVL